MVVLPSTTELGDKKAPDASYRSERAAARAASGERAGSRLIPLTGAVQLKADTNVGCSFVARFLSQVAV